LLRVTMSVCGSDADTGSISLKPMWVLERAQGLFITLGVIRQRKGHRA